MQKIFILNVSRGTSDRLLVALELVLLLVLMVLVLVVMYWY